MSGVVLDAGALIAFERANRHVVTLVARLQERKIRPLVPAGVIAQVWRDGRRQARLARLLQAASCEVVPLDDFDARASGQLLGATGTTDVVDASVVWCARKHSATIVTSDPDDLRRLDPKVRVDKV